MRGKTVYRDMESWHLGMVWHEGVRHPVIVDMAQVLEHIYCIVAQIESLQLPLSQAYVHTFPPGPTLQSLGYDQHARDAMRWKGFGSTDAIYDEVDRMLLASLERRFPGLASS